MHKTNYPVTAVHKIAIFPFGMINAFLLVNSQSCVLVDSGLPDTERKIESVLTSLNLTFTDINLIVLTHAHIDHAGNASKIKSLSRAKVIAHSGDLPYFRRQKEMQFCSTGWFGRTFLKSGVIKKPYPIVDPDILLSSRDTFSLGDYGINGEVISTPGHTEGSISVVLDNDKAVVGDLISSGILLGGIARTNKAKRPPFEESPLQVSQALQSIANQGIETYFMGHGGPLPRKEVLNHIRKLEQIASRV